jgi:hypothetical protein
MSTVVHPKGHRHSRSAVLPPNAASPHNPQSPYHLGLQAQAQHPQPAMDYSAQLTTPPRTPRRENGQASSQNKGNSSAPEVETEVPQQEAKERLDISCSKCTERAQHSGHRWPVQRRVVVCEADIYSSRCSIRWPDFPCVASPISSANSKLLFKIRPRLTWDQGDEGC